jgi:hypothetical protein
MLGLGFYLAWRQRQRTVIDAAARCFAAFVRSLTHVDVPARGASEGPQAYAARAAALLPGAAADIAAIAASYLRARYEPDPDRQALAELESRVGAFRPPRR